VLDEKKVAIPSPLAPRKLCIVVRDTVGGICRYSHELAQALVLRGVSVAMVCRQGFPHFEGASYTIHEVLGENRAPSSSTRLGALGDKVRLVIEQVLQPVVAFRFCRKMGFDFILFSNGFHFGHAVWRHFRHSSQIMGLSVHDVHRGSRSRVMTILNRQLPKLYRDADLLFVHDDAVVPELMAITGKERDRIVVVPHGVYPYPKPSAPRRVRVQAITGVKTGLFFGTIRDEKRLDLLLAALALRKEQTDWRLVVAGAGSGGQHRPLSHYVTLSETLGIRDRVVFHDEYIAEDEVHQFFEAADWTALVYSPSFTSQSGVLATAAHFGVPVVTSGAPLLVKTVSQYAIGANASDDQPESLLAAIKSVEQLGRSHFSAGCERFAMESSWEVNARLTIQAFEQASRPWTK